MHALRPILLFALSPFALGQAAGPSAVGGVVPAAPVQLVFTNPLASVPVDAAEAALAAQALAMAGPSSGLCYTLRSYRFERQTPHSDATRYSGSTTCEPSGAVHSRAAVVTRPR